MLSSYWPVKETVDRLPLPRALVEKATTKRKSALRLVVRSNEAGRMWIERPQPTDVVS